MVGIVTSIYRQMHDAIEACDEPREVLVIGSNDGADSARWRIPDSVSSVRRFDALAEPDGNVERAVVHNHAGILTFFQVDTSEGAPADWIRGISSLRPESNAQNLRSGTGRERDFISTHRFLRPAPLTPVRTLGTPGVPKFFILDIEGMDYDVSLSLFRSGDVVGIGCEHALMSSDELILLRCAAIESGFRFVFGEEDAIFLRKKG